MNDNDVLKELVQKAAAGDKTAFEKLYQETCRSVYFTCLNILKDEQEAQDLTQDVYLTALEKLSELEDAGKFKSWLYRIAANKSIKRLKKKKPLLLDDEQLEDAEAEENENFLPEEYALNAEKRALVLEITRKVCTEAQYQTILLYYFNELSVAEIAEIMECQESNVKKRLSIARAKIKEGVLRYEEKSGDKLYAVAVIPFLTTMFTAQMQGMPMPSFSFSFPDAIPKSSLGASAAKTGRRIVLKGLQLKITAGIAIAVVVGGVAAAAVTINNQRAQEASAGAQEESALDVANAENSENTPELDTQPTEAETPETAEEVKAEEVTTPEETEEPETAEADTEPTAEPEYTYTDMSATMYASQTVNVRDLPSTDGNRVGGLSTNQEIAVTGQCNETGWYRFEYNGSTAYVSNNYVSETMTEEPVQTASTEDGGGTGGNTGKEPCPYPLNVVTIETTEYGLRIYVLYTTMPGETIWVPMYSGMQIENSYLMTERDAQDVTAYGWDVFGQQDYLEESTGVFHGLHFTNPPGVKIGTYAEGTVYRFTAGGHFYNTYDPAVGHPVCPNNYTGCQPGTIN